MLLSFFLLNTKGRGRRHEMVQPNMKFYRTLCGCSKQHPMEKPINTDQSSMHPKNKTGSRNESHDQAPLFDNGGVAFQIVPRIKHKACLR